MTTRSLPLILRRLAAGTTLLLLSACAAEMSPNAADTSPLPDYAAIVQAPDRTEADRTLDQRRQPEKLLQFYGVRHGMHVLDMGASAGYNSELLARAVGEDGIVYAQNTPDMLANVVKGRLAERIKRGTMPNVLSMARPFEEPVLPDTHNIDLVTMNFVYHDTAWLGVDRAKMNRAIYDALRPGGVYIVADHSAKAGAGADVAKSLHRIDEALVRREVEAAGFRLAATADFLRNPDDPRDANVFKNPVRNDEFVLKFVKPASR